MVVLALDDLSNAACEAVPTISRVPWPCRTPMAACHLGKTCELFFRTIIGMGANPDVAAAVVIGIEPEWTNIVVEGIKKTGKPVTGFGIERHGDITTVAEASRQAKEYLQWASELKREEVDLSEIWVSAKCGESDTTSGLASNPTVGNAIDKLVARAPRLLSGKPPRSPAPR